MRAADPAADMIPRTENKPSMEPKTSSAPRLPVSSTTSSVLCTARKGHPRRACDMTLFSGMSVLLLDDSPIENRRRGYSGGSLDAVAGVSHG
jgi:hypothetical protein